MERKSRVNSRHKVDSEVNLPVVVSKSQLARHFHRGHTQDLRKILFTDDVLTEMGLSIEAYRKITLFTPQQTRFIYEHFGITNLDGYYNKE